MQYLCSSMVERLPFQAKEGGSIPSMNTLVDVKTTISVFVRGAYGDRFKTGWRNPRRFKSCSTHTGSKEPNDPQ